MTDFKSEMRESLEVHFGEALKQLKIHKIINIENKFNSALSSLLALIEKKFPDERECSGKDNEYEQGCVSGFNQCLSEIKREMGI